MEQPAHDPLSKHTSCCLCPIFTKIGKCHRGIECKFVHRLDLIGIQIPTPINASSVNKNVGKPFKLHKQRKMGFMERFKNSLSEEEEMRRRQRLMFHPYRHLYNYDYYRNYDPDANY